MNSTLPAEVQPPLNTNYPYWGPLRGKRSLEWFTLRSLSVVRSLVSGHCFKPIEKSSPHQRFASAPAFH